MAEQYGDPHAFDDAPRGPRRSVLAAASGALVGVALLAAGGFWVWGLTTRDPGEIPFLRAEPGEMRVRPADSGGLRLDPAERAVTRIMGGDEAGPIRLSPAPEAPADEDLPLPLLSDRAAPPPAAASTQAPDADDDVPAGPGRDAIADAIDRAVAEALREAPPPLNDAADGPAPRVSPVAAPRPSAPSAAAAPAATATPPAPSVSPALAPGALSVQLGAFNTAAIAEAQWRRHLVRNADVLGALSPMLTPVQSGGRTLWRLRAGPFPDAARARAVCASLADRGDACILARIE